ncbi:CLUMA_CG014299, isoform B [Clunio marinus]|uniref:WD repeat domain-containing protein 83 n=1 Tax=Clunio marinus TaxID=568069 RepID=A0A1J1IM09_9DIPT|nr:CLUMA_CG014299, isoform B [Clunio marinus]
MVELFLVIVRVWTKYFIFLIKMNYELKKSFECDQGAVRAVRYNVDGNYCLTCGSDRKIKLFNPKNGLMIKTYAGHGDEVNDAVGSCDSGFILSGSADKSIIYWDVSTGLPVRRLRTHAGAVSCVKFNEDSSVAISGSRDNTVQCFDIRTRALEPIQTLKEAKDCITGLIVTEHKIISSSLDGCIRHYDLRAGELTCDKVGEPITAVTMTSDEQCVLASCQDGVIRLIDIDGGEALSEYRGHLPKDYKIECGLLKNDSHIISGSSFGCVIIWDFLEAKQVNTLRINKDGGVIQSLNCHPTNEDILVANRRQMQLWSTIDFEIIEDEKMS